MAKQPGRSDCRVHGNLALARGQARETITAEQSFGSHLWAAHSFDTMDLDSFSNKVSDLLKPCLLYLCVTVYSSRCVAIHGDNDAS